MHVVLKLPDYVSNHGAVIGNYVRLALECDVLEVLQQAPAADVTTLLRAASHQQVAALVAVLARLSDSDVTVHAKQFLRSLPLFDVTTGSAKSMRVSVEEVGRAAPEHGIPVTLEEAYLALPTSESRSLARKLDVDFMSPAQLLVHAVLPKIQQRFLPYHKIEEIMVYVLDNIHMFKADDPEIIERLSDVPFVTTTCASGEPKKPRELFDPESSLLTGFFEDESVFPGGRYVSSHLLMLLRKMKLKGDGDISAKDVLYAALHVEDMLDAGKDVSRKTQALSQYLIDQPAVVQRDVNGRALGAWLADIAWVPVLSTRVPLYPHSLPWAGGAVLAAKPSETVALDAAFLAGSSTCVCSQHFPQQVRSDGVY